MYWETKYEFRWRKSYAWLPVEIGPITVWLEVYEWQYASDLPRRWTVYGTLEYQKRYRFPEDR